MDITEKNFPLYPLLIGNHNPMGGVVKRGFEAAANGGDEEQYAFAMGIQTIAAQVSPVQVPNCTQEIMRKTLKSCLQIFNELSEKGHEGAKFMVLDFEARGLGL